jgi:hypothetical protein
MVLDSDGRIVDGRHSVEPTAFFIHYRVHVTKEKKCVLHAVTAWRPPIQSSSVVRRPARLKNLRPAALRESPFAS